MAEESGNRPKDVFLSYPRDSHIIKWVPPGLRDKWSELTAEEKEAVRRNPPPLTSEDIEEIRRLNPLTEVHPLFRSGPDQPNTHLDSELVPSRTDATKPTTRPRKKSLTSLLHGRAPKVVVPEVPRNPYSTSADQRRDRETKERAVEQKITTPETPNTEPKTPGISSSEHQRRKKKVKFTPGSDRQMNFEELAQKYNIPQRDPSTPSNLDAMSSPTIYLSRRPQQTELANRPAKGHKFKENNRPQLSSPSVPIRIPRSPPRTFEEGVRNFGEEAAQNSSKSPSQLPQRPKAPTSPRQPSSPRYPSNAVVFPVASPQARSTDKTRRSPLQERSQARFPRHQTQTLPLRGAINPSWTPQSIRLPDMYAPPLKINALPQSSSQSSSSTIRKQITSPISAYSTTFGARDTLSRTQAVSHSPLPPPVPQSSATLRDASTPFDDFSDKSLTVAPTSYALSIPKDPVSVAQPLSPTNNEELSRVNETPSSMSSQPNSSRRRRPIDPAPISPSLLPSFAGGTTTSPVLDLPTRVKSPRSMEKRRARLSQAPIRSPKITKRSSRQKRRPPSQIQKAIPERVELLPERTKENEDYSASEYSQSSHAAVGNSSSSSHVDLRPAPLNIRPSVLKQLDSHADEKADDTRNQEKPTSKCDNPVNSQTGEGLNQGQKDATLNPNISGTTSPAATKRSLPHLLPLNTSPIPQSTDERPSPITPTKAGGRRHERKNALLPSDIPKTIAPVTAPQVNTNALPKETSTATQESDKNPTPIPATLEDGNKVKQGAEATRNSPKRRPSPLRLTSPTAPLTRSIGQSEAPTTPTRSDQLAKKSADWTRAWNGSINGRPEIDTCLTFTRYLAARMAENPEDSFTDFVNRTNAAFAWLRRYGSGGGLLFHTNEYPVPPKKGFGFLVAPLWIQETHRYDVLERIRWNAFSIFGMKIFQEHESFARQSGLFEIVARLRTLLNIPQVSLHFVGTNSDTVLCRANSPYISANPFCNLPNFAKIKRSNSVPAHIILSGPSVVQIFDVQKCLLTRHNAVLIAKSNIQFYAGIPIFVSGQPIAVLEMVDQSLRRDPLNAGPITTARDTIQAILQNIHSALEPEIPSDPPTTGQSSFTFDSPTSPLTPVSPINSTSPTSPVATPPLPPQPQTPKQGKALKAKKSAASLREGFKKALNALEESSSPPVPPVPPLPPAPSSSYFEWSDEERKRKGKGKGKGKEKEKERKKEKGKGMGKLRK